MQKLRITRLGPVAAQMRQLTHPHLVRFRESFTTEDHLCIIMDFCQGGDLQQRLKAQRGETLPEATVVLWLAQLNLILSSKIQLPEG